MRTFVLFAVFFLGGCSVSRQAGATYHAQSNGTVTAGVRSAADAVPGVTGPQEIAGLALPFGPFMVKGALTWDGTPLFWGPTVQTVQVAPQAVCAPPAPQIVEVEETFTEMVPVQRTRRVQRQVVTVPVPQQIVPQAGCPAPPAPAVSSVTERCDGGVCAPTLAQR